MDSNIKISVVIPCYEQKGLGQKHLKHSLDILAKQTFKDFEVVVSDNSTYFYQNQMEGLCKQYPFVRYIKNINIGLVVNTNHAIKHARGQLIKILFQDDFLYSENSLQEIWDNFKGDWMVTACEHSPDGITMTRPFYPKYNDEIYLGNNTISSPSVLTIKNGDPLLFDEDLEMFMDVDYYKRCYDKFGEPTILNTINVVNRVGDHQVSMNVTPAQFNQELELVKQKYVSRTM
jgi:glycosyltransferase involved in cell wall biosynthesis